MALSAQSRPGSPSRLLALATLLLAVGTGCETTRLTSLEENRAAYQDARQFLQLGRTSKAQVTAKYGEPREIDVAEAGDTWRFWLTETVFLNAHTETPLGSDRAVILRQSGFQHTVACRTVMEILFDPAGLVSDYRLRRELP